MKRSTVDNTTTDVLDVIIKGFLFLLLIGGMGAAWFGLFKSGIWAKEKLINFSDSQALCRAQGSIPTWKQYQNSTWTPGGWCTPASKK